MAAGVFAAAFGFACAAHAKDYVTNPRAQERGYSEAVVTEGGKMVWLAGQTATVDDSGKSLAGDFDGQVRQLFRNLDRTLQKAGGRRRFSLPMSAMATGSQGSATMSSKIIFQAAP